MRRAAAAAASPSTSEVAAAAAPCTVTTDTADPAAPPGAPESGAAPCWSCASVLSAQALFCHACGAVQPPRQADHFARLGLPQRYDLEPSALDRQYFGFQRRLHPDRFARKPPRERALSQAQAAALNEAYETLKAPLRRAAYLAGLRGVDLPGDGRTIDDPDLLMEAMESREDLLEARSLEEVDKLAAQARAIHALGLAALGDLFLRGDAAAIRKTVLRLRYLEKFADEARARRANLEAGQA